MTPDTSIRDVIELTQAHSISGVPVVEGSELVGIVTSQDVLKGVADGDITP